MSDTECSESKPVEQESTTPSEETASKVEEDIQPTKSKPEKKETEKVLIILKPTGDAPIMKKQKWDVDVTKTVAYVSSFIKKYIKANPSDSLFLYVNQSFAASPDQTIKNLSECFGSDGSLILHYCKTQAWG